MTTLRAPVHGGRLLAAQRAFPFAPKPWLDLSTGINPVPYPFGALPDECWTRLPEPEEIAALEAAAARAYGVRDAACVVAAPGAQSLIQLLPLLFPAADVFIRGPTYEEHAHRWRAARADVTTGPLHDGEAPTAGTMVVVNPNNPDGALLPRETLSALADTASARRGLLVVDESFVDALSDDASFAPAIGDRPVVVLRSFGKMYGLAGLRLGFAIAPLSIAARLRDALGPWVVSGMAVAIGTAALADVEWRDRTRARLHGDAARLDLLLVSAGCHLVSGTPLFRLVRHSCAAALQAQLGRAGILVRAFPERSDLLRFGLPHPREWQRLAAALHEAPP